MDIIRYLITNAGRPDSSRARLPPPRCNCTLRIPPGQTSRRRTALPGRCVVVRVVVNIVVNIVVNDIVVRDIIVGGGIVIRDGAAVIVVIAAASRTE